jgi:hypothetical protein
MTRAFDRRFFVAGGLGSRPARNSSSASRLIRHRGLVADRLATLEARSSPDSIQPRTVSGSTRSTFAAFGGVDQSGRFFITGAPLDCEKPLPLVGKAEHLAEQLCPFADLRQLLADGIGRRDSVDRHGDGVFASANIHRKTLQGIASTAMLPKRVFGGYGKVLTLF